MGSSPIRPTSWFDTRARRAVDRIVYRCRRVRIRPSGGSGHIEQLMGGCWRAKICAGRSGHRPGDPAPQDMRDRTGRADRARQAARAGCGGTPARLGRHRGPAARPVRVDSRLGCVDPGEQPRAITSGSPQSRTDSHGYSMVAGVVIRGAYGPSQSGRRSAILQPGRSSVPPTIFQLATRACPANGQAEH